MRGAQSQESPGGHGSSWCAGVNPSSSSRFAKTSRTGVWPPSYGIDESASDASNVGPSPWNVAEAIDAVRSLERGAPSDSSWCPRRRSPALRDLGLTELCPYPRGGQNDAHWPLNLGGRFSRNAVMPSRASAVSISSKTARASTSRPSANGRPHPPYTARLRRPMARVGRAAS